MQAYLFGENSLGGDCGINAVSLDGDNEVATSLQEVVGVQSHDTGLIGLGNVSENAVHHIDEHAVLQGVAGILNDGDNVGAGLGHVDEVTAGTVGEFHGVHNTLGAHNVRNMGHSGTRGGTQVQHLLAGAHPDTFDT